MIAYAITDPSTLNFNTIETDLSRFLEHASMIVYRDKVTQKYKENAKLFIDSTKGFDKVLLHGDSLLAHTLNADGVHLKSTQFSQIQAAKKFGLYVVVSTHTLEEAIKVEKLGANMITLSPIFNSPNKGKPIGLELLREVTSVLSIPVIALGGILTQDQIASCVNAGAKGFASIRYFR